MYFVYSSNGLQFIKLSNNAIDNLNEITKSKHITEKLYNRFKDCANPNVKDFDNTDWVVDGHTIRYIPKLHFRGRTYEKIIVCVPPNKHTWCFPEFLRQIIY